MFSQLAGFANNAKVLLGKIAIQEGDHLRASVRIIRADGVGVREGSLRGKQVGFISELAAASAVGPPGG